MPDDRYLFSFPKRALFIQELSAILNIKETKVKSPKSGSFT